MSIGRKRSGLCLALAGMLSVSSPPALALDPALDVSQYAHTAWRIDDGFTNAEIMALAQTVDGYLWLGTSAGLMHFDGARSVSWQSPAGSVLPDNRIRALLASRDNKLWIGTQRGLASWDGTKLITYAQFNEAIINGLAEDREGTIWVAAADANNASLCAIRNGNSECSPLGEWVGTLYQANDGSVWTVASGRLERRHPGAPKQYAYPEPLPGAFQALSETASGTILIVTRNGILQLIDSELESFPLPVPLPVQLEQFRPERLFRDRDGSYWIGSFERGLLHVREGRADSFSRADGLSGDGILSIFEDREGNIWVATTGGLDRFRALAAARYSTAQGLPPSAVSLVADDDGSVWVSTTAGLHRWKDGRISVYRARSSAAAAASSTQPQTVDETIVNGLPERSASLFNDSRGRIWVGSLSGLGYLESGRRFVSISGVLEGIIDAIAEDKQGNLWIAHRGAGLLRVTSDLKVEHVAVRSGATGNPRRLAADPVSGIWVGFLSGSIVHLVDGAVRASYSAVDGLGEGFIGDIRVGADGAVWVATEGGLNRIAAGRVAMLAGKDGLPCDAVASSIEDGDGATWIYMGCGLVRIAGSELNAWASAVDEGKAPQRVQATVLDNSEGVRNLAIPLGSFSPVAVRARDGKLWFLRADGVMAVDPRNLPFNELPPLVHIEQVVADRTAYPTSELIALPPLVRDLSIDYTALSLVAPEKVLFRYKLEGRDIDWQDAGNRRQAFYTDLSPGNYRFRVMASNNSGVWNEEGSSLDFSIAPAYWQTNWFLALCAAVFIALLGGAYRMRMRHLARAQASEKRHRELRMELAHASRLATMGQLSASIAHEVNQPLGAAVTNAQAALRWLQAQPPELAEVRQALNRIVRDGNRASDVIGRVRGMLKKAPAHEEYVFFNDEIIGIVAITHSEAMKHEVSVRTELSSVLPTIKGDRVQLQQVLLNLIVNAIEAMSTITDGTCDLVIRSEADGDGGVIVSVRDSGPGLEAGTFERIFEPFYTSKKTGLGMGLSVCRSIIEAHGGKLWATANTPRGAVFQFTLPAKPS